MRFCVQLHVNFVFRYVYEYVYTAVIAYVCVSVFDIVLEYYLLILTFIFHFLRFNLKLFKYICE